MKKKSTKLASLVLAAVVALNGLALPTFAAVPFLETQTGIISKQVNYTPGVTVTKPTAEDLEGEYGAAYADAGFKVTFTFCSDDASIQSVSVGGNMNFYTQEDCKVYAEAGRPNQSAGLVPKSAYEYRVGMTTAQNNAPGLTSREGILYEMEKVDEGIWSVSMPLPAQQYVYKYILTYANGSTKQSDDPANPADVPANVVSTLAGQSIVYVGTAADAPTEMNDFYPVKEKYQGTLRRQV